MPLLSAERLLALVIFQTEIAKARMDLGEVLTRSTELSQTLTDAAGAVVEMMDGPDLVYRATSGMAQGLLGQRRPKTQSLSGRCVLQCLEERAPVICLDTEADPRVDREGCRAAGFRALIVAPLIYDDTPVGVLKVLSQEPGAFDDQAAQALGLMSQVIAASMVQATEHGSKLEEIEALYQRATRDALTGLANRALFYDQLRQSLALARRQKRPMGIALLDMDGLKSINDHHGHRAGDAALRALATRLQKATRASDTVARLGGDEFGVLLSTVQDPEAAAEVGRKISRQVEGPFEFEGRAYPLGASVGLAVYPDEGLEPEGLMALADERMYAAKRTRKGTRSTVAR